MQRFSNMQQVCKTIKRWNFCLILVKCGKKQTNNDCQTRSWNVLDFKQECMFLVTLLHTFKTSHQAELSPKDCSDWERREGSVFSLQRLIVIRKRYWALVIEGHSKYSLCSVNDKVLPYRKEKKKAGCVGRLHASFGLIHGSNLMMMLY